MRLIALLALCAASVFAQGVYQITIPSGQAVSGELAIDPRVTGMSRSTAMALAMPSAWTAADLLVEASVDGSTWLPVYDSDGARARIRADASRMIVLDGSVFWGLPRIRFRSVAVGGTSDVNQGAARTLTVIVR